MRKISYEKCLEIKTDLTNNTQEHVSEKHGISVKQCRKIGRGEFDYLGVVNGNTTTLRKIPIDELRALFTSCYSYSEIIRKCNLDVRVSYIKTLKKIEEAYEISTAHFKTRHEFSKRAKVLENSEIFNDYSNKCGSTVRKRVLKYKLISHVCAICGNEGIHNNLPLVLQLDHINGNNRDNRLENLRFLCPNCHAQTDNFTGKNIAPKINHCMDCGVEIAKKKIRCGQCSNKFKQLNDIPHDINLIEDSGNICKCGNEIGNTSKMCKKCVRELNKDNRAVHRRFEISKEELEKLIKEYPMTKIGKMLGVSDNAVKKRCKFYKIELKPMRGYWRKLETGKIEKDE